MRKADALVEALPYIQAFRRKFVVVKLGGAAMEDESILDDLVEDVVFLNAVGVWPIIVHGGGPHISAAMKERGKDAEFVSGLRVTDDETLEIVLDVLVNGVCARILDLIGSHGGRGLAGFDNGVSILRAEKTMATLRTDAGVEQVDIGHVGRVTAVDTDALRRNAEADGITVVPPIGQGASGEFYNVNADTVAAEVAGAVGAEKVVFLSNVHGILRDPNVPDSYLSTLTEEDMKRMVEAGTISAGMLPKTQGCIAALDAGVRKAHIIDGRMRHSLLLEIFTVEGVGTQIVKGGG